jgi:peptidoglycan/LPS O-acetylase OafA/YrhL
MRRLLRIFPCFYVYLFTLMLLKTTGFIEIGFDAIWVSFLYVQNFNLFQNTLIFPYSWFVGHSWSLSVEEQFYMIFPFVFSKIKFWVERYFKWFLLLACMFCTFFRALNYSFPEVSRMTGGSFFMHADFLLFGAALAIMYEPIKSTLTPLLFRFKNAGLLIALVCTLMASKIEYYSGIHILIFGNVILLSNLYIVLYFLLFPNSFLGKLFETSPFRFVGKLSYGLYVWQQLFLGTEGLWLKCKEVTLFPLNFVLIFAIAIASYYLIEKPFLKLKNRFSVSS